jgi:hypothetical protein
MPATASLARWMSGDSGAVGANTKVQAIRQLACESSVLVFHMTIAQYKTVRATETKDLDALVNAEISEGFQPFGSPYTQAQWLCQAVVHASTSSRISPRDRIPN